MKWHHLDNPDVTELQLYVINVVTAASRLLNAVALGDPNESICRRVHDAAQNGSQVAQELERIIDIALLEPGHCRKAADCPCRCRAIKRGFRGKVSND